MPSPNLVILPNCPWRRGIHCAHRGSPRGARCHMVDGYRCRNTPERPDYDAAQRVLLVGQFIPPHFLREAWNLIAVLVAFQGREWAPAVPSALPKGFDAKSAAKSKTTLKNTIHHLNRAQDPWLVRFHGRWHEGTISWEWNLPPKKT